MTSKRLSSGQIVMIVGALLVTLGATWGGRIGVEQHQRRLREGAVSCPVPAELAPAVEQDVPVAVTRTTEHQVDEVRVLETGIDRPVPGAMVRVAVDYRALLVPGWDRDPCLPADESGGVVLPRAIVGAAPLFWVLCSASGFGSILHHVERDPGMGSRTEITIERLQRFEVSAVDPDRRPVADAQVCFTGHWGEEAELATGGQNHPLLDTLRVKARTDQLGHATLWLSPSIDYVLSVRAPWCETVYVDLSKETSRLPSREVVLCPIVAAGTRVRDRSTGRPSVRSAGGLMGASSLGSDNTMYSGGRGDPSEEEIIALLDARIGVPGVHWYVARLLSHPGSGPPAIQRVSVDRGKPVEEHPLRFRRVDEFAVDDITYLDTDVPDLELATLTVRFQGAAGAFEAPKTRWGLNCTGEARGYQPVRDEERYVFRVPPGDYNVNCGDSDFYGRDFALLPVRLVARDEKEVVIPLTGEFAQIAATAEDAWGRPLINWDMILLFEKNGAKGAHYDPPDSGRRSFGTIAPGKIELYARAWGLGYASTGLELKPGDSRTFKFVFDVDGARIKEVQPCTER